jgi:predicted nuclease of predicted toxin-antitoxin system
MRLLLDECVPARLRYDLTGCEVQTVPQAGWAGIKNGRLLNLIAQSGKFDMFLAVDKNLPHEQKISGLPFAVLVCAPGQTASRRCVRSCRKFFAVYPASSPAKFSF